VLARKLRQGQRALGQGLVDQHGRAAAAQQRLDDRARGIGAVAGEPSGSADAQDVRRRVHCAGKGGFMGANLRRAAATESSLVRIN
jgi:hypothetical protein